MTNDQVAQALIRLWGFSQVQYLNSEVKLYIFVSLLRLDNDTMDVYVFRIILQTEHDFFLQPVWRADKFTNC